MPGLNSQPFHDTKAFPWIKVLEENFPLIKREYTNLVQHKKVPSDYDMSTEHTKLHSGEWDWHSYILKGKKQPQFVEHCPETTRILDSIEGLMYGTPLSYAFFSTLHGNSRIQPHTGPANLRLRCHFPLSVPTEDSTRCGIRVGETSRPWRLGEAMLFDDTYEHEVWNNCEQERVVLLLDVWHPDLTIGERESIQHMFGYARQQGWVKS